MTTDFVADVTTWVVVLDRINLIQVDIGLEFTTNQTCSVFTDEAKAIAYAIEHGWTPTPPEP